MEGEWCGYMVVGMAAVLGICDVFGCVWGDARDLLGETGQAQIFTLFSVFSPPYKCCSAITIPPVSSRSCFGLSDVVFVMNFSLLLCPKK